jgi:hypothetical protein
MELIKKAFRVWHDGMLSDNPHEGYRINELPVTYADSPGEAKSLATEPFEWTLYDDEPKFTDLKVRRAAGMDKVMFEGDEKKRWQVEMMNREQKRIEKRRQAVDRFPDNSHFYIQNGYVGNSVLWWGKNSNGYTSDIHKAELYTKQEVLEQFVNGREEDVIWESEHIHENIRSHVDGQYLSKEYRA